MLVDESVDLDPDCRLKVAVGLSGIALLHSPNLPHTYINDVLDVCSHHSQLTPHTASHTLHHSPNTAVHHPSRFCRHLRVTFITAVSSALTLRACPVSDTPSTVNTHPLTHHSRVYRNVIILATTGAHTAAALTADCRLAADTSVTTTASTGVRSALNSFLSISVRSTRLCRFLGTDGSDGSTFSLSAVP